MLSIALTEEEAILLSYLAGFRDPFTEHEQSPAYLSLKAKLRACNKAFTDREPVVKMSDPSNPTNPNWVLYDPLIYTPPPKVPLLLGSPGGTLITGPWVDNTGLLAWGYKPVLPETVKNRA